VWNKKDFLNQKEQVIKNFKKNPITSDKITDYAVMTGIPITVVCEFVKEEFPEHTEICDEKIAAIKEFFNIKD